MTSLVNAALIGPQGYLAYGATKAPVPRRITNVIQPDGTPLPNLIVQVWIEEHHRDDVEITSHPVEFGASITDHAFSHPAEITLMLGWSNTPTGDTGLVSAVEAFAIPESPLLQNAIGATNLATGLMSTINGSNVDQVNAKYAQLLTMKKSLCTFTLETGKRIYDNVLIKSLVTETTKDSADSLFVTMVCQQLIVVNTQLATLVPNNQKTPGDTAPVQSTGNIPKVPGNIDPGVTSKLLQTGLGK